MPPKVAKSSQIKNGAKASEIKNGAKAWKDINERLLRLEEELKQYESLLNSPSEEDFTILSHLLTEDAEPLTPSLTFFCNMADKDEDVFPEFLKDDEPDSYFNQDYGQPTLSSEEIERNLNS